MGDNLNILISAVLDEGLSEQSINTQLKSLKVDKIKVGVTVDTSDIKKYFDKIGGQSKTPALSGSVFNVKDLEKHGQKYLLSTNNIISRVKKEYQSMGSTNITNIFKDEKGSIQRFTAEVTKANGVLEKYNYNRAKIKTGNSVQAGFIQRSSVGTDKSAGSDVVSQMKYLEKVSKSLELMPSKIRSIEADFKKLKNVPSDIAKEVEGLGKSLEEVEKESDPTKKIEATKKLETQIKRLHSEYTAFSKESRNDQSVDKIAQKQELLLKKGQAFFSINTKAAKKYANEWSNIQNIIKSGDVDTAQYKLNDLMLTAKANGDLGDTLFGRLTKSASKFFSWIVSSAGIMLAVNQLRQMISTVKELDASLVDLQMATGSSRGDASELLHSYSNLGDELGATTTDVSKAASDWLRQGKSVEETNTLIKNSMILSKVGAIESSESTKYLTTAMKGNFLSLYVQKCA